MKSLILGLCAFSMLTVPACAIDPASSNTLGPATVKATLDDASFLVGEWRGGDDFVFEETWSAPSGKVMTGMARGVASGELAVLEYIILAEENDTLVMRFKHYNADFSTWEESDPVTLLLNSHKENSLFFYADPPSENVRSINYELTGPNTLKADIVTEEDGVTDGFTLVFTRVD